MSRAYTATPGDRREGKKEPDRRLFTAEELPELVEMIDRWLETGLDPADIASRFGRLVEVRQNELQRLEHETSNGCFRPRRESERTRRSS